MEADSPFYVPTPPTAPVKLTSIGIYFCEQNSCFELWKAPIAHKCPRCSSDQGFKEIYRFQTTYQRV